MSVLHSQSVVLGPMLFSKR